MRHGTRAPNREEAAYMAACKTYECVACAVRAASTKAPPMFVAIFGQCDFHHFKSGNIRIGHLWGVALCRWHHERHALEGWSHRMMADFFGPSLKDGSHTFHRTYGSDVELLEAQDNILRDYGIEPPSRPGNRRWAA